MHAASLVALQSGSAGSTAQVMPQRHPILPRGGLDQHQEAELANPHAKRQRKEEDKRYDAPMMQVMNPRPLHGSGMPGYPPLPGYNVPGGVPRIPALRAFPTVASGPSTMPSDREQLPGSYQLGGGLVRPLARAPHERLGALLLPGNVDMARPIPSMSMVQRLGMSTAQGGFHGGFHGGGHPGSGQGGGRLHGSSGPPRLEGMDMLRGSGARESLLAQHQSRHSFGKSTDLAQHEEDQDAGPNDLFPGRQPPRGSSIEETMANIPPRLGPPSNPTPDRPNVFKTFPTHGECHTAMPVMLSKPGDIENLFPQTPEGQGEYLIEFMCGDQTSILKNYQWNGLKQIMLMLPPYEVPFEPIMKIRINFRMEVRVAPLPCVDRFHFVTGSPYPATTSDRVSY